MSTVKGVGVGQDRVALAGEAAEHRVREPGEVPRRTLALGEADRDVDGGVVRHVEEEHLGGGGREQRQQRSPFGSPFGMRSTSARRMVPKRRKATTAMARASASSRGSRAAARAARSNTSSSARPLRMTSSTMSQARRRAGRPAGSSRSSGRGCRARADFANR